MRSRKTRVRVHRVLARERVTHISLSPPPLSFLRRNGREIILPRNKNVYAVKTVTRGVRLYFVRDNFSALSRFVRAYSEYSLDRRNSLHMLKVFFFCLVLQLRVVFITAYRASCRGISNFMREFEG